MSRLLLTSWCCSSHPETVTPGVRAFTCTIWGCMKSQCWHGPRFAPSFTSQPFFTECLVSEVELVNGSREYGPKESPPVARSPVLVLNSEKMGATILIVLWFPCFLPWLCIAWCHHGAASPKHLGDREMREGEALSVVRDKRSTVSWSVSEYKRSHHSSLFQSFTTSVAFIAQSTLTLWHLKPKERLLFPHKKGSQRFLWDLESWESLRGDRYTLTMGKGLSPSHLLRYLYRMCRVYPKTHGKGLAVISRRWGSTSCLIWIERWWHKLAYKPVFCCYTEGPETVNALLWPALPEVLVMDLWWDSTLCQAAVEGSSLHG